MKAIIEKIQSVSLPVLPVIKVEHVDEILPIAETLIEGGILVLEITLRTEAGLEAISLAKKHFPQAIICAGTVVNTEQMIKAADNGAEFIITPGVTETLISTAIKKDLFLLPGVATPSDVMLSMEYGLESFKLFPAIVSGGIQMLNALKGPFPSIQFCPTGGLNSTNFVSYLELSNVFCIGGSWMMIYDNGSFQQQASLEQINQIKKTLDGVF